MRKKPGEPVRTSETRGVHAGTLAQWSGVTGGGTRGSGCGVMVRTPVVHRGTGPGPLIPLVLRHFPLVYGPVFGPVYGPLFGDTENG